MPKWISPIRLCNVDDAGSGYREVVWYYEQAINLDADNSVVMLSSGNKYSENGRDTMQVEAPVEFNITLFHEQRERLSNGEWTEWHPMDLNDAQKGLSVEQRFQRRVNGRCTEIMIYDDTPGVRFEIDHETIAPDSLEAAVSR